MRNVVNGTFTSLSDVNRDLNQGCFLCTLMFKLFINDLLDAMTDPKNDLILMIHIISALAYDDCIILLSESKDDLNNMLHILNNWCETNDTVIKPHVVHLRKPSVPRTTQHFFVGRSALSIAICHSYLISLLTEHLDFNAMAKAAAKSVNRDLCVLISNVKTKYTCLLWPERLPANHTNFRQNCPILSQNGLFCLSWFYLSFSLYLFWVGWGSTVSSQYLGFKTQTRDVFEI